MKNILNKIEINYFTYYFIIVSFFCGFIKNTIIIFFIIFIHELGHIIVILLFKYKIEKIKIYPFGGLTVFNKYINSSIYKDICIAVSGVLNQMIIIYLILKLNIFTVNTNEMIIKYNYTLAIFNLLPIIPLDGSKLIESILNKFYSFKKSYYLTIVISIVFIIIFFIYNMVYSINNYLIISILIISTILYYKNFKVFFNKFLLERIMYEFNYFKITCNTKCLGELKKEHLHYFNINNKNINEQEIIKKKFDKDSYF